MKLNVLVLENEPGAATDAATELRAADHNVLTCHDAQTASFPCRGIVDASACPLRSGTVDVALDVRVGTRAQPTLGEDGTRCALVHRVPLVVAGAPLFDPFDELATRTIDRTYDVVTACEQAADAPIVAAGRRAEEALVGVAPDSGRSARVEVRRRAGRLVARVSGADDLAHDERSRVAVRIVAALRELDPYAAGIDVAFGG